MIIVACPKCNKLSERLDDETALRAIDCPNCGFTATWLAGDDIDIDTRKIDIRKDATDDDWDDFMKFLNELIGD